MVPQARPDVPLAEYWIGAHPKGPAQIELDDGTLVPFDEALRSFPQALLGHKCVERFGEQLPYMVKVLSVNREHGLSIQLHPTREQARSLRAKAPEHYPDDNHKPEVGIALTEVSLLYGCKSLQQIQQVLRELPGLKDFIFETLASRIESASPSSEQGPSLVKELFSACLTLTEERAKECVEYLRKTLPSVASLANEAEVLGRLAPRYGAGDVGLIALLLMNHVVLRPGQAIFIAPNVPHAYLDGDLFECMACSDNVVRAGLTPKYKDTQALVDLVDCSSSATGFRDVRPRVGELLVVETPTEEFCVRIMGRGSERTTIQSEAGPGVVLCIGGRLSVKGLLTDRSVEVGDGGAVFIPGDSGEYVMTPHDATLFYVTPSLT
jgi:mannose-6-phosphate isomerase